MTEEADLLRAIRDDPDDDAPRLIYADWLEERGDPRAEFIRIQCELARLPAPTRYELLRLHPRPSRMGESGRRYLDLIARHDEILTRYYQEWTGPLRQTQPEFHRGFVERITVSARSYSILELDLDRWAPLLSTVMAICLGGTEIRSLITSSSLSKVTELALTGVDDADLEALAASPYPVRLRLLSLDIRGDEHGRVPFGYPDGHRSAAIRRLADSHWMSSLAEIMITIYEARDSGRSRFTQQVLAGHFQPITVSMGVIAVGR
jgi:uncharacterized protein (TIGR02996 family)